MPPKRGARGGGRAASRTPGPQDSPATTKLSTAYGSPAAPSAAPRTLKSGSATSALSSIVEDVDAANAVDRAARPRVFRPPGPGEAANLPARGGLQSGVGLGPRPPRTAQVQVADYAQANGRAPRALYRGASEDDETDADEPDVDDDRARMPPPPPRRAGNRKNDENPASDNRSFTEEGNLYQGADLQTPRSRRMRSETPSRTSARIAAKKSGANVSPLAGNPALDPDDNDDDDDDVDSDLISNDSDDIGVHRARQPDLASRLHRGGLPPRDLIRDLELVDDQRRRGPNHNSNSQGRGQVQSQTGRGEAGDQSSSGGPGPATLETQAGGGGRGSVPPEGQGRGGPKGKGPAPAPPIDPNPPQGQGRGGRLAPASPNGQRLGGRLAPASPNGQRLGGRLAPASPNGQRLGGSQGAVPPGDPGRVSGPQNSQNGLDNDGPQNGPQRNQNSQPQWFDNLKITFDTLKKAIFRAWHNGNWSQKLWKALRWWGILTALCMFWLIFLQVTFPPARWEGIKVSRDYRYRGLANWRQNVAQYVPWVVLHPFAVLTGNLDYADFRTTLSWAELNHQHNSHRLDELAAKLGQMRRILPDLIAVRADGETGKWTVGDKFWYALNQEMKQGGIHHKFALLQRNADGTYNLEDSAWDAIRFRITNDALLLSDRPADRPAEGGSVDGDQVSSIIDRTFSQRWNEWLRDNEDAINRVQGIDKELSASYAKAFGDFDKQLTTRIQALNLEERLVSRTEFVERLNHVSEQFEGQIRTEMESMQGIIQQAIEVAERIKQTTDLPDGTTREELNALVNAAVEQAVRDAQLESISKGGIKSHLEEILRTQKNFFSTSRGAIVDTKLSSSSYDWVNKVTSRPGYDERNTIGFISSMVSNTVKLFRGGGEDIGPEVSHDMALERWKDDGECWCAAHAGGNESRIADLAVFTANIVIPQHLVVEHITATGTFDHKAMPKDLEVWMRSPDGPARRTLMAWSRETLRGAPTASEAPLVANGFVKIGEFTYDNNVSKGEKQVFKLSEKLIDFGAQTQHIVVRSTSNYGAEDHTCFYRLRLFGKDGIATAEE